MRVLVSGGAGYIGSHTVLALIDAGHDVVVVDDFSNSKPSVVGRMEALSGTHIPVHAFDVEGGYSADPSAVGESVAKPFEYYTNNLDATFSLIRAMRRYDVHKLVFSSSATVYGDHAPVPYREDYEPLSASSPYGRTKVMSEHVLADVARAGDLKVALLRYFNPVGAHSSGTMGEDPQGVPNNLMPFIAQVAVGRREKLQVFGDDYPTADGTCERDYIHVDDLAAGHVAALEKLDTLPEPVRAYNLGGGQGTSVLELFHAFERAVGRELPYEIVGRRAGDLPAYWADPTRAADELGWRTQRTIDDMCADVWRWQSQNPDGFPDA